jgi:HSP20 family protein
MHRTLFMRDLFGEVDRLQREFQSAFEGAPQIRGQARGGYPALNVGSTAEAVEVYAFAPGLEPSSIKVDLDRGVLSLSGERARGLPAQSDEKTTLHQAERFAGRFRRVVNLPDDIDPTAVNASYRDGLLRVSVARKAATPPRRIEVR